MLFRSWHAPLYLPATISTACALLGLSVAILTLRARRAWILFALVPLFANSSLLFVPWLAGELSES